MRLHSTIAYSASGLIWTLPAWVDTHRNPPLLCWPAMLFSRTRNFIKRAVNPASTSSYFKGVFFLVNFATGCTTHTHVQERVFKHNNVWRSSMNFYLDMFDVRNGQPDTEEMLRTNYRQYSILMPPSPYSFVLDSLLHNTAY